MKLEKIADNTKSLFLIDYLSFQLIFQLLDSLL